MDDASIDLILPLQFRDINELREKRINEVTEDLLEDLLLAVEPYREGEKSDKLCRKEVMKECDTWTRRETGRNGTGTTCSEKVHSKFSVLRSGANTGYLDLDRLNDLTRPDIQE